MTAPLPDDDLLALIEGELAPERIERIRTVLMRDPALLRRLEAMQRDRALTQRVGDTWAAHPPINDPRLISDAVEQAERDALLHEAGGRQPRTGRHRATRSRRLTMAASIVLGAGLLGLWSWLLVEGTRPSTESRSVPANSPQSTLTLKLDEPDRAELAGPPSIAEAFAAAPSTRDSQSPVDDADITDAWLRSAGMIGVPEPQPVAVADAPVATPGMSLAQAARLALEGRLKIVTDRSPGTVVRAMAMEAPAQPLAGPALDLSAMTAPRSAREITLRIESSADAQSAMERELSQTVQHLSLSSGASLRFEEINRPAVQPSPSLTFDDILWWSRPAAEWRQRIEVRVPIELAPDAPTP